MREAQKLVRVAQAEIATGEEVLVTLGLGSCVAVLLHDPDARVAGLAHVLLPDVPAVRDASNPAKFATTAVPHLLERMEAVGAERRRVTARLVGGASMFGALLAVGSLHTGVRNVEACRAALRASGVPILAEDVGEEHGRSVSLRARDGRVRVRTAQHGEREL